MAYGQKSSIVSVETDLADIHDECIAYVQANCAPEDVFSDKELIAWAEDHGYAEEE